MLLGVVGEVCEYVSLAHIVTSHVLYDWAKADAAVSNTNQTQILFIAVRPPPVELRNTQIPAWRPSCRDNLSLVRHRYCCRISWKSLNSYCHFLPSSCDFGGMAVGLLVRLSRFMNSERFVPGKRAVEPDDWCNG